MKYDPNINGPNDAKSVEIIVSRNCNLRCSYCYVHKHKEKSFDIENIVFALDNWLRAEVVPEYEKDKSKYPIIGVYPEAWLNIDRTNEIITRVYKLIRDKYTEFTNDHMISLGTNGVRLTESIPIIDHIDNLSVNVTLDGNKAMHDMYRVFANGKGSWDIVKKNIKEKQEQYNIRSTKVTVGPETIKYMYDSVLFLWDDMKFIDVNMNVPFENIWGTEYEKKKSVNEYEKQLDKLSNYVIKNQLWNKKKYVSVVGSRNIPQEDNLKVEDIENRNYCGAATMRTIDTDGSMYPCFRFVPFNLTRKTNDRTWKISESKGYRNKDILRSLNTINLMDAIPQKCLHCKLLNTCSMCVANAYDEFGTIFGRTIYHCEFKKLEYKYANLVQEAIDKEEEKKCNFTFKQIQI